MAKKVKIALIGPNAYLPIHNHSEVSFEQYLTTHGYQVVREIGVADVICSIEVPVNRWGLVQIPSAVGANGLLVIQEPKVVRPRNSSAKAMNQFASVMKVGRPGNQGPIFWPVIRPASGSTLFGKPKLQRACLVASDNLSFIDGELYSLRRTVLRHSHLVDLYGRGWNAPLKSKLRKALYETWIAVTSGLSWSFKSFWGYFPRQRNYGGALQIKEETVSRYKVSVVIENDASYVSEKLLEAIQSGSIPVYVGPDLAPFGVPTGLVVQVEANVGAILIGIETALSMSFESWSAQAQEWLDEIHASGAWSPEALWSKILEELLVISRKP